MSKIRIAGLKRYKTIRPRKHSAFCRRIENLYNKHRGFPERPDPQQLLFSFKIAQHLSARRSRVEFIHKHKNMIIHFSIPDAKHIMARGRAFLDRISKITTLPDLSLSRKATVFVVIPLYKELANVDRLFRSWHAQQFLGGIQAEVIFLVNNKADASPESVQENQLSFDRLAAHIKKNRHPSINFHVIDKYSQGKALPSGTSMGDIRNIAMSPVIRHALATHKNGIIISTDADSFPSPNLIAEAYLWYARKGSCYGAISRNIEYDSPLSDKEKRMIKEMFLLNMTDNLLADYLTYGEWVWPETMAGANLFYTTDAFLMVDGYSGDPEVPEDYEIANKLRSRLPDSFVQIQIAHITNIIRYSDRVEGDGAALQWTKERMGMAATHAGTTQIRAFIAKWLLHCLSHGLPYRSGRNLLLKKLEQLSSLDPQDNLLNHVKKSILSARGKTDKERYESVYQSFLTSLESYVRVSPQEALRSYEPLILDLLGSDPYFCQILSEIRARASSRNIRPEYIIHTALSEYALLYEGVPNH